MSQSTCMHSVYLAYSHCTSAACRRVGMVEETSKSNRSKGWNVNKNLGTYGIHICKHIVHVRHMSRLCTKSIYLCVHNIYGRCSLYCQAFSIIWLLPFWWETEGEREKTQIDLAADHNQSHSIQLLQERWREWWRATKHLSTTAMYISEFIHAHYIQVINNSSRSSSQRRFIIKWHCLKYSVGILFIIVVIIIIVITIVIMILVHGFVVGAMLGRSTMIYARATLSGQLVFQALASHQIDFVKTSSTYHFTSFGMGSVYFHQRHA